MSTASSLSSSFRERNDSPIRRAQLPSPTPTTPPPDKPECIDTASSTSSPRALLSVPTSILPILHLFANRLHEDYESEIYEFDVPRQDYQLLWVLLGLEGGKAWPTCVSPYLEALRADGLPATPKELSDLGRWVLDSVRYDFFSLVDASGAISTRLWIRMPTIIHDQTANSVGQLLRDAIIPGVGRREVTVCSMKCEFSDRFQRMLVEQRQITSPTNTRLQARSNLAREQRRAWRAEADQRVVVVPGASEPATAAEVAADLQRNLEKEQEIARYEEAQPDVCIFVGELDLDIFPSVIVEVGFSHPLPFDRARSFIYGSEGRCRVVICLDIEYREKEKRLQEYQAVEAHRPVAQRQIPPYKITLNLFRCDVEAAPEGHHDTYTARHELKHIDVREAAQQNHVLELHRHDLIHPDEDYDDHDENQHGEVADANKESTGAMQMAEAEPAKIAIPYAALVKIVDKAAWSMAVREQPSLQLQRKRKRPLMPKLPSTSPEPEADAPKPKKRRQR